MKGRDAVCGPTAGSTNRSPTDRERGLELGRLSWRPELLTGMRSRRWSGQDLDETLAVMLNIGLDAGAQGPSVVDRAAFFEGVMDGFDMAEAEFGAVAVSHQDVAACDPNSRWGPCEYCSAYAIAISWSRQDKARWVAELADSDVEFVILGPDSMVHTRRCSVVTREVARADELMARLTPAMARHGGMRVRWPHIMSRFQAESARRRRCSRCCPDLPDRRSAGPIKGADGRFVPAT